MLMYNYQSYISNYTLTLNIVETHIPCTYEIAYVIICVYMKHCTNLPVMHLIVASGRWLIYISDRGSYPMKPSLAFSWGN
jgi:hypothetical protein